jgi:hypothetical protein
MARKPYRPQTEQGFEQLLVAFDTNINADSGALAAKYSVSTADLDRIHQARLVWGWFMEAIGVARHWPISLTETRDMLLDAPLGPVQPLPGGPTLPPPPLIGPSPGSPVQLEPGFFFFFFALIAQIKKAPNYEEADGIRLGIEGPVIDKPDESIVPLLTGEIFSSGHPELTCKKGVFQGYTVWLTRPGQPKKEIGFSTGRRFNVTEPLPAAGMAEVWTFEVQYRYQGQPFGQVSQPLNLTVRG